MGVIGRCLSRGRWHNFRVGARDGPDDDARADLRRGLPDERAEADKTAERPPPAIDEARQLAYAVSRQRTEGGWEPRRFEAPRAELARFDPERAGLPRMSVDDADRYIAQHKGARPWLTAAEAACPESRRILAALDAGGGHGHIRHEGWVTEWANMRRVTHLEDPAQLDAGKQARGIDGLKPDDRPHWCRTTSSRITDPDAFATAFARGTEHPKVQEALGTAFDPDKKPREVTLPIADLLGPDGHECCTGWRLDAVDGSMRSGLEKRDTWIAARDDGRESEVAEPRARPVPSFEGGAIVFVFGHNAAENRYEILTMFPRPVADKQSKSAEGAT